MQRRRVGLISYGGTTYAFVFAALAGLVMIASAVMAYLTPVLGQATSCGTSCAGAPGKTLYWTGLETLYLLTGIGLVGIGIAGSAFSIVRAQARVATGEETSNLQGGKSLLPGVTGTAWGVGLLGFLASLGTSGLLPNGGGAALFFGGCALTVAGLVLGWKGARMTLASRSRSSGLPR